jgi:hypothetical protein
MTAKLCLQRIHSSEVAASIRLSLLNNLTEGDFVFFVVDMMKNCGWYGQADRILELVGVNVGLSSADAAAFAAEVAAAKVAAAAAEQLHPTFLVPQTTAGGAPALAPTTLDFGFGRQLQAPTQLHPTFSFPQTKAEPNNTIAPTADGGTPLLGGQICLGDSGGFAIGSSSNGSKSGRRIVKAKRPTSRVVAADKSGVADVKLDSKAGAALEDKIDTPLIQINSGKEYFHEDDEDRDTMVRLAECPDSVQELVISGLDPKKVIRAYELVGDDLEQIMILCIDFDEEVKTETPSIQLNQGKEERE